MAVKARNHGGMVEVEIDLVLGPVGVAVPVNIEIGAYGLKIRRKGRRLSIYSEWDSLITRMAPHAHAPAKFLANPAGLLMEDA